MIKFVLGIVTMLIIILVFDYLLIPDSITIIKTTIVPAKRDGLYRLMVKDNNWMKCINEKNNEETINPANQFYYEKNLFTIDYKTTNSIIISIKQNSSISKSTLSLVAQEPDSTLLIWNVIIHTTFNPFKRLNIYYSSRKLSIVMQNVLNDISSRYSKMENIYGIDVHKEEVKDSILIFTSSISPKFPSTMFIYQNINKLKDYVKKCSANITNYPMLNITKTDSGEFLVRVALPVDKALDGTKDFSYKRMMGRGKILLITVRGGYDSINKGFENLINYVNDYHFESPAIPFQSLVTDRTIITDSSKWITNIYYPVR